MKTTFDLVKLSLIKVREKGGQAKEWKTWREFKQIASAQLAEFGNLQDVVSHCKCR